MEDVGIFYGYLVYFKAIWYIVLPIGILCGRWVYLVCCIKINLVALPNRKSKINSNLPPYGR
jgi:hypothetical protein